MKKINLYMVLILFAVLLLNGSCQKEDWTYSGPQYYEFSAQKNNQAVKSNLIFKENSRIGLDSVCVQLIKNWNSEVVVNFEIVENAYYLKDKDKYTTVLPEGINGDRVDILNSNALYGTDYEIVQSASTKFDATTKKGSIVIPKGEYFGYIEIDLKQKSGTQFFIKLTDSRESDVLANLPTSLFNYVISPDKTTYLDNSFLTGLPADWTLIDKDGDGYNWDFYGGAMTSDSYLSSAGALTPENYLVSPAVTIPSRVSNLSLTFEVSSGASGAYREQYRVVVSEVPMTLSNCRDATVVRDWTELKAIHAKKNYTLETIDLTSFKGKTIYIGFVHGNCSDEYYINLRNVKLFSF